jgi:hypothetical protein
MRFKLFTAAAAAAISVQPAFAQAVMTVPYGGTKPAPVAQAPKADPDDTPEEIAKDAERDLKDSRFYNRPGATRAQYDADWQICRLIARGSRTPSGSIPYSYNPAVISPVAAGVGGALGGLLAGAIAEGSQRRANRRTCLLIKGWRLVEVPAATATRVAAMTDADRSAYFDSIVGAEKVEGEVTERTSFELPADANLRLAAPLAGPGSLYLGKKVDPNAPFALAPGEAAIVFGFRRPDEGSAGRSGSVSIARYDAAGRDLLYRPRDWKKTGDKTTYSLLAKSKDKKAGYEVQVMRVTPGDYVLSGSAAGNLLITNSYCFGAPTFHVEPGEVAYIGDFVPYLNAKLSTGGKFMGVAYTSRLDEARTVLAASQAALASALKPAPMRDRATYGCSAQVMDRWDLPGVEDMPEPPAPPAETPAPVTTATRN